MPLYQRIRDLREDADKTQTEIAEYLGTTAQYYGKYEKGEITVSIESSEGTLSDKKEAEASGIDLSK